MKRLSRMVAAVLLTLSGPAVAAVVAYDRLDHEWWTSAGSGTAQVAPPQPQAEAVPTPSPQTAPTPPRASSHPHELGSCVTAAADPAPCSSTGALRVVGSIGTHTGKPCHDVPETTHVRRAGAYTLCLAAL